VIASNGAKSGPPAAAAAIRRLSARKARKDRKLPRRSGATDAPSHWEIHTPAGPSGGCSYLKGRRSSKYSMKPSSPPEGKIVSPQILNRAGPQCYANIPDGCPCLLCLEWRPSSEIAATRGNLELHREVSLRRSISVKGKLNGQQ
jgi:hypothetical protein